jgi:hypothetical protein
MINVIEINVGDTFYSTWNGMTDDGKKISATYRSGTLHIEADGQSVFSKFIGTDQNDEEVIAKYRKGGMDEDTVQKMITTFETMRSVWPKGPLSFELYLTYEQLKEATKDVIKWPEPVFGKMVDKKPLDSCDAR